MADELDKPSFGNFSINNTMEMGMGSQELLDDLLSSDTATASPEEVEKLENKEPEKKKVQKPVQKTTTSEQTTKKEEEEKPKEKTLEELLLEEEIEEEEVEQQSSEEGNKEGSNEGDEVSKFEALARDLFKLNVFTKEEGEADPEIKTPEQFLERFHEEKKKGAIEVLNNFIGQHGEDYQQAFQAIFVNGANPKEYFTTYNNIQNFAELDLTKETNQEAVIKQFLSEQGLDAKDVDEEVERIKNYGDLEKTSEKYHKVLVKKESQKLQDLEKESATRLQQAAQVKQQYIQNVNNVLQEKLKAKEFDGIPINPKLASELQDFLLRDKYKTPSGEPLTDFDVSILELKRPENHATKVKVALLLKILEKDPTLSTIQKAGVSKQSNALFSEVARQTSKSSTKSSKQEPVKSWFS